MATHIEALGGGRVAIFTTADSTDLPGTAQLAANWQVDGMLLDGSGQRSGSLFMGSTLKGELTKDQLNSIDTSPGFQTMESWMMTCLARADAFLSGSNVFDGTGLLDAGGKARAEAAAKALQSKIGSPVYIDIALGGDDPSGASFFAAAHLSSDFNDHLIIALAVSGTTIDGSIETSNSSLWEKYQAETPWKTTSLTSQLPTGSDVQAALLADIVAVKSGSGFGSGSGSGSGGGGISSN
jgi:hypothetical protein